MFDEDRMMDLIRQKNRIGIWATRPRKKLTPAEELELISLVRESLSIEQAAFLARWAVHCSQSPVEPVQCVQLAFQFTGGCQG